MCFIGLISLNSTASPDRFYYYPTSAKEDEALGELESPAQVAQVAHTPLSPWLSPVENVKSVENLYNEKRERVQPQARASLATLNLKPIVSVVLSDFSFQDKSADSERLKWSNNLSSC